MAFARGCETAGVVLALTGAIVHAAFIGRDGTRTHTPLTEQGILSPRGIDVSTDVHLNCDNAAWPVTSTGTSSDEIDTDLRRLIDAWPALPFPARQAILSIVRNPPTVDQRKGTP